MKLAHLLQAAPASEWAASGCQTGRHRGVIPGIAGASRIYENKTHETITQNGRDRAVEIGRERELQLWHKHLRLAVMGQLTDVPGREGINKIRGLSYFVIARLPRGSIVNK